jgi:restriction endonuclease S subunit
VSRAAVVDDNVPERSVFASYLIRLKVDQNKIRSSFLGEIINSQQFRRSIRGEIKSSAGNYNLNTKGIKRQRITMPPLEHQDEILRELKSIDHQIARVGANMVNLKTLKASLFSTHMGLT